MSGWGDTVECSITRAASKNSTFQLQYSNPTWIQVRDSFLLFSRILELHPSHLHSLSICRVLETPWRIFSILPHAFIYAAI